MKFLNALFSRAICFKWSYDAHCCKSFRKGLALSISNANRSFMYVTIKALKFLQIWCQIYNQRIFFPDQGHRNEFKTMGATLRRAEANLDKISNNINKTHTGLISVLQGFQKCVATRAGRANQHSRFGPILANWPKLAVLASTVLPCPNCQDFMQHIFGILEAH